ncbi:MAG: hypothetical protein ACRD1C_03720 [Terriglobales bacterium]
MRARLGRAARFRTEAAEAGSAIERARKKVWGRTGPAKVAHAAAVVGGLPHWLTFDFLDAGIRLQMFASLTRQGYTDREAALAINDWLVDYGALRQGKGRQPLSRVFYTAPYMLGAARASAVAELARRHPRPLAWAPGPDLLPSGGIAVLRSVGHSPRSSP